MPLIDKPFKRAAVDIVGPIEPPSEAGHRYILTLVDYGTKYPEAVPLKKITTEAVAEALLNIYSRVGIPEKVLTDQGTQFMCEYASATLFCSPTEKFPRGRQDSIHFSCYTDIQSEDLERP